MVLSTECTGGGRGSAIHHLGSSYSGGIFSTGYKGGGRGSTVPFMFSTDCRGGGRGSVFTGKVLSTDYLGGEVWSILSTDCRGGGGGVCVQGLYWWREGVYDHFH